MGNEIAELKRQFDLLVERREAARKCIDGELSYQKYVQLKQEVNDVYKKLMDARYAAQ